MTKDQKPIANPVVMLREEFDDWAVLFDPDTGHGFGLSPTGVYVWKLLDGEHTMGAIVEEIRHHVDNVPKDARDHIEAFVTALVAQGLAGSDRTRFLGSVPEESSSYPPGALNNVLAPFIYEPPQLVVLGGAQAAHGDCSGYGSGAGFVNGCISGAHPGGYNCSTGTGFTGGGSCPFTGAGAASGNMCESGNNCSDCANGGSASPTCGVGSSIH